VHAVSGAIGCVKLGVQRLFSQLADAEKVADFSTLDFAL